MPIDATCPNTSCSKRYSVPDSTSGRSVRCKACGGTFIVSATTDDKPVPTRASSSGQPAVKEVGRFVVRQKLGAGAFGTVYRAYDPQLDREVALKVPNPGTLDSPLRVERFLREAKAAARLRHPHIVPVFDAGKDSDRYYIASAFIAGKPLADTIEETGTDFRRAARLVRELAEALAYAHGEGIVHRDVKPANAMLDAQDRLHLMDFGLATRAEDSGEAKLTKDGAVMGTPAYMSPEQAKGQKGEAKPATDQYAAGVVLYELLTGEVPFKGPVAIVIHNVIRTEPDRPSARRADVPRDLETICLKAMSKRPADRYADCQELADDLRRWLEDEPITARRLGPVERATRWAKRNPLIAGSVAFAFAALVIGFTVATAQKSIAQDEAKKARAAEGKEAEQRGVAEKALDDLQEETGRTSKANADKVKALEDKAKAVQGEAKALADKIEADKEKVRAVDEKEAAQRRELDRALMAVHYAAISTARDHALKGEFAKAREVLARCPFDQRGWEWHFLFSTVQQWEKARVNQPKFDPRLAASCAKPIQAFRPTTDGKRLVAFCADGFVRTWNAATGAELESFAPEAGADKPSTDATFPGVAISPDGTRLAAALKSRAKVGVWDIPTRKLIHTLETERGADTPPLVMSLNYSSDGRLLACGTIRNHQKREPARVVIWDAGTGQEKHTLPVERDDVMIVALSPDGRRVAGVTTNVMLDATRAGGQGQSKVLVWDLQAAAPAAVSIPMATYVRSLAFSPDGKLLACGERVGRVRVMSATDGSHLYFAPGPTAAVAFTPDGRRLIGAEFQPGPSPLPLLLKVWDAGTGQEVLDVSAPATGVQNFTSSVDRFALDFLPDGVAVPTGLSVRVFDAPRVREPFNIERGVWRPNRTGTSLGTIGVASDGKWVVSAASERLDPVNAAGMSGPGTPAAEMPTHASFVQVWNAKDGRLVAGFNGPAGSVARVAVSTNGRWVAVLSNHPDRPVGKPDPKAPSPGGATYRVNVSLWDAKTQQLVRTWADVPIKQARGIGFRSDGTHLSVVSDDGAVAWRVAGGAKVDDVRFDKTETAGASVWTSDAGDVIAAPKPPAPATPNAPRLALTPDGKLRASLLPDGAVTLEELP